MDVVPYANASLSLEPPSASLLAFSLNASENVARSPEQPPIPYVFNQDPNHRYDVSSLLPSINQSDYEKELADSFANIRFSEEKPLNNGMARNDIKEEQKQTENEVALLERRGLVRQKLASGGAAQVFEEAKEKADAVMSTPMRAVDEWVTPNVVVDLAQHSEAVKRAVLRMQNNDRDLFRVLWQSTGIDTVDVSRAAQLAGAYAAEWRALDASSFCPGYAYAWNTMSWAFVAEHVSVESLARNLDPGWSEAEFEAVPEAERVDTEALDRLVPWRFARGWQYEYTLRDMREAVQEQEWRSRAEYVQMVRRAAEIVKRTAPGVLDACRASSGVIAQFVEQLAFVFGFAVAPDGTGSALQASLSIQRTAGTLEQMATTTYRIGQELDTAPLRPTLSQQALTVVTTGLQPLAWATMVYGSAQFSQLAMAQTLGAAVEARLGRWSSVALVARYAPAAVAYSLQTAMNPLAAATTAGFWSAMRQGPVRALLYDAMAALPSFVDRKADWLTNYLVSEAWLTRPAGLRVFVANDDGIEVELSNAAGPELNPRLAATLYLHRVINLELLSRGYDAALESTLCAWAPQTRVLVHSLAVTERDAYAAAEAVRLDRRWPRQRWQDALQRLDHKVTEPRAAMWQVIRATETLFERYARDAGYAAYFAPGTRGHALFARLLLNLGHLDEWVSTIHYQCEAVRAFTSAGALDPRFFALASFNQATETLRLLLHNVAEALPDEPAGATLRAALDVYRTQHRAGDLLAMNDDGEARVKGEYALLLAAKDAFFVGVAPSRYVADAHAHIQSLLLLIEYITKNPNMIYAPPSPSDTDAFGAALALAGREVDLTQATFPAPFSVLLALYQTRQAANLSDTASANNSVALAANEPSSAYTVAIHYEKPKVVANTTIVTDPTPNTIQTVIGLENAAKEIDSAIAYSAQLKLWSGATLQVVLRVLLHAVYHGNRATAVNEALVTATAVLGQAAVDAVLKLQPAIGSSDETLRAAGATATPGHVHWALHLVFPVAYLLYKVPNKLKFSDSVLSRLLPNWRPLAEQVHRMAPIIEVPREPPAARVPAPVINRPPDADRAPRIHRARRPDAERAPRIADAPEAMPPLERVPAPVPVVAPNVDRALPAAEPHEARILDAERAPRNADAPEAMPPVARPRAQPAALAPLPGYVDPRYAPPQPRGLPVHVFSPPAAERHAAPVSEFERRYPRRYAAYVATSPNPFPGVATEAEWAVLSAQTATLPPSMVGPLSRARPPLLAPLLRGL